jgi:hypothetical protein
MKRMFCLRNAELYTGLRASSKVLVDTFVGEEAASYVTIRSGKVNTLGSGGSRTAGALNGGGGGIGMG